MPPDDNKKGDNSDSKLEIDRVYNEIEQYRQEIGLGPYTIESGNTVASINLDGERIFGVNSTITKESQEATKALRQKWFEKIQWVPPKKKQPLHLGHAQSLTHAEAHALINAFENRESLPKKLTMVVDRKTCNMCRGELPALLKTLGLEELTIYSGGLSEALVIKAIQ